MQQMRRRHSSESPHAPLTCNRLWQKGVCSCPTYGQTCQCAIIHDNFTFLLTRSFVVMNLNRRIQFVLTTVGNQTLKNTQCCFISIFCLISSVTNLKKSLLVNADGAVIICSILINTSAPHLLSCVEFRRCTLALN